MAGALTALPGQPNFPGLGEGPFRGREIWPASLMPSFSPHQGKKRKYRPGRYLAIYDTPPEASSTLPSIGASFFL